MIIPRFEEVADVVARNATSSSGYVSHPTTGNEIMMMVFLQFIFLLPMTIFFGFIYCVMAFWVWLSEPRNLVTFLSWIFTFIGVAIILQRRGVRKSEEKAAEFFQSRGYSAFAPKSSSRRKLSPIVAIAAVMAASTVALVVWACGKYLVSP